MQLKFNRLVSAMAATGFLVTAPNLTAVAAEEEEESTSRWEQMKSLYNEKVGSSEEPATDDAVLSEKIESIQSYYRDSKDSTTEMSKEAYEWLQDDIAKIGAWDYNVLSFKSIDEDARNTLTQMGRERWELVSAVASDGQVVFVLKRPMKSFVKVLPAQEVLKLMGDMSPELAD